MVNKDSFWHILIPYNNPHMSQQLSKLFIGLEYQGKKIVLDHLSNINLFNNPQNNITFHLILIPELKENTETLLSNLRKHDKYAETPIFICCDESSVSSFRQKAINSYNIEGFIDLNNWSSFNIIQLVKLLLKNAKQFDEYKTKEQGLINSTQALTKISRLMSETELLSLSGGWEWDIVAEKLTWSQGVYQIHDLPINASISSEQALNFYLPDDRLIIQSALDKMLSTGEGYDLTLNIKSFKDKIKTIRTTGRIRKVKGEIAHIYGSITDTSTFTDICKDIENKKNFISGILDGISDAVIVTNDKGDILEVNPASEKILGYPKANLINNNISMLITQNKRKKHQSFIDNYSDNKLVDILSSHRQVPVLKANGKIIPAEIIINKIIQQGTHIYISLIRDITNRIEAEERIQDLAFKDRVTKLANYQSFEKDYGELLTKYKSSTEEICFVQINIEKFFKINFAYGHSFGNQVLRYIAELLKTLSDKHNGTTYRISGISFILMFTHKNNTKAILSEIKNSILSLFLKKHKIDDKTFDLTPVITMYSEPSVKLKKLGREVLTLMESCKQSRDKKCNLTLINEQYLSKVKRELLIEQILKQAIESGKGLYLVYQPQVNSKSEIRSAEALIRMNHEQLGIIYPDEFIKIAERTGLIIPLTKWILHKCLTDISELISLGIEIPISVNISTHHIVQTDFVDDILSQLNKVKIPPNLLMLELTESAFTDDIHTATINMVDLSNKKVKFSLDDFGTGYSNLGYLNQLPFNELKIDKIFIDNVLNDKESKKLLEIIISIGKMKGLKIVAEGVETIEQANLLQQYDVDLFQGYYYSKPIKFVSLKEMLLN